MISNTTRECTGVSLFLQTHVCCIFWHRLQASCFGTPLTSVLKVKTCLPFHKKQNAQLVKKEDIFTRSLQSAMLKLRHVGQLMRAGSNHCKKTRNVWTWEKILWFWKIFRKTTCTILSLLKRLHLKQVICTLTWKPAQTNLIFVTTAACGLEF